ncbi:hypothetical protein GCM10011502_05800 [Oceanisphaera marina]|uniref:Uncharacterized protein n=1 Tax=Oceanisphaera marina TaxID=2017550 RepID=A0ABQ1ID25_9GAMM|nr:hypothetical protein GCM10011502_05800 [Oceanisphaera marina]
MGEGDDITLATEDNARLGVILNIVLFMLHPSLTSSAVANFTHGG